ncbi:hypothetical protein AB4254_11135 [Vibrio breoganii]
MPNPKLSEDVAKTPLTDIEWIIPSLSERFSISSRESTRLYDEIVFAISLTSWSLLSLSENDGVVVSSLLCAAVACSAEMVVATTTSDGLMIMS